MAIKNVLLCAHPENDFMQQVIWKGLVQVLGNDHVAVLPNIEHFRGRPDAWYILQDGKQGYTGTPSHLLPEPDTSWTRERIYDRIGDFDLMILCSPRSYALASFDAIRQMSIPKPPLVIINGEDYGWSQVDEEMQRRFTPKAYFKRELTEPRKGVYPLPFASFVDAFPAVDDTVKRYSVFCVLGNTWPARMDLLRRLAAMRIPDAYIGTDSGAPVWGEPIAEQLRSMLSFPEYIQGVAQSKISVTMRGFGRDSLHMWEQSPWNTCLFYADPGLVMPHPFVDRVHAVQYAEDGTNLESALEYYLTHDEERQSIAAAGKAHALQYHTTKARAEYLLNITEQALQGSVSYSYA